MNVSSLQLSHIRVDEPAGFVETSIGGMLREATRQFPDRVALVVPASAQRVESSWTYRELEAGAEASARALLARFVPGDRVATWAGGSSDIIILHLGAALAGIVLVTLNPANRAAELDFLLKKSQARGLFFERAFRGLDNVAVVEQLKPALPDLEIIVPLDEWSAFVAQGSSDAKLPLVAPDSAAMILFTSGTTGKPKGAVLVHQGVANNARLTAARLQLDDGSVWLNLLPMFHIGGSVTMTLGCISNFGTQVLLPEFSAEGMLAAMQCYGVDMTMAVPTMLVAALQSPAFAQTDFSKLKVIVTGGTVVAPELVRTVRERFGAEVMSLFGQTEAGGAMCVTRRGDDVDKVTQSVGAPLPLSEAKIVRTESGDIAPIGTVGEICVRTRCAMREYFGEPSMTRETLDAEGWVHTGDLGVMRPDGYLQVTGRLKDMIIRGGENIYPREIEDALAEHPAVSQSAVFGVPDEKWGEQVAAAVILKPGQTATGEELALYLQARTARHKVPKVWQFVAALPVNASGKIQKFLLREQFGSVSYRDSHK